MPAEKKLYLWRQIELHNKRKTGLLPNEISKE